MTTEYKAYYRPIDPKYWWPNKDGWMDWNSKPDYDLEELQNSILTFLNDDQEYKIESREVSDWQTVYGGYAIVEA